MDSRRGARRFFDGGAGVAARRRGRSEEGLQSTLHRLPHVRYRTFKKQRMPDWTDLTPQDVTAILDWLAADGPDQKPADERDAELANAADLARARALFEGRVALASGGAACASCHTIRDHEGRAGGTLGPDLTGAYLRYRDRALTLFLRHPCTPREPELGSGRYLEPEEAFALKAYLREAALAASPFATYPITEAKRGHP
jgi:mono/diheme cytochrome c family protein